MEQDLIHQVGKILTGYNMVAPGMHLGVAVSGGADSITLLHILHKLRADLEYQLTVLHVNHQLRGTESDEDERFVRSLAEQLAIPCRSSSQPVPSGNVEQEARRSRRSFFAAWQRESPGARVALGHTRSDQCETLLFRLFRGSGTAGLAAMAPITESGFIRPLLHCSRSEVRAFASQVGLTWREDSSNQDLHFRRNRLRLVTIPALTADYNPALEQVIARTAEIARDEEQFWDHRSRKLFARLVNKSHYGLLVSTQLTRLQMAEQRRLLRRCLLVFRKSLRSIDSSHIEALLELCNSTHGHDRLTLPGVDAIRSFQTLLIADPEMMRQPRSYQLDVCLDQEIALPFHSGRLNVKRVNFEGQNCATVKNTGGFGEGDGYLDRDVVDLLGRGLPLQVRNWEPGDRLQPLSASHPAKIKTLFQESKVPLWERRHWPVLLAGKTIVWARAFGMDASCIPRAGTTRLLQVGYQSANLPSGFGK